MLLLQFPCFFIFVLTFRTFRFLFATKTKVQRKTRGVGSVLAILPHERDLRRSQSTAETLLTNLRCRKLQYMTRSLFGFGHSSLLCIPPFVSPSAHASRSNTSNTTSPEPF